MKNVLVVFGTRPEAIKLCPLVLEFRKHEERFKLTVCVTAQHREMLDPFLQLFGIRTDYDLNVMVENQKVSDLTAKILEGTSKVVEQESPDIVVVQGDTTTTFAASLAAYYQKVPVGHVEAGLRTYNKYAPFPEEINRKLTTVIADLHFAPTERAKDNLLGEGVSEKDIRVTGNTVIDALLWVRRRIREQNKRFKELEEVDFQKRVILVTGHRRENFGQDLKNVCQALGAIATRNPEVEIVYPVHLNPNVRNTVYEVLKTTPNVKLLEPLDYEPFVQLMDGSYLIITDSGGIQEEAPSLGKPVLVTRQVTERPEAVDAGCVRLVGTDRERIVNEAERLLRDAEHYKSMAQVRNPYGDGQASGRIVQALDHYFSVRGSWK
jgi:UDP-N-acetylglucosamine 2-epimerase (non-hydrolysing)